MEGIRQIISFPPCKYWIRATQLRFYFPYQTAHKILAKKIDASMSTKIPCNFHQLWVHQPQLIWLPHARPANMNTQEVEQELHEHKLLQIMLFLSHKCGIHCSFSKLNPNAFLLHHNFQSLLCLVRISQIDNYVVRIELNYVVALHLEF